jgi:hypothetical protein
LVRVQSSLPTKEKFRFAGVSQAAVSALAQKANTVMTPRTLTETTSERR